MMPAIIYTWRDGVYAMWAAESVVIWLVLFGMVLGQCGFNRMGARAAFVYASKQMGVASLVTLVVLSLVVPALRPL